MRANPAAFLSLPLLAAGARHGHLHHHKVGRRHLETAVVTVTEIAYETVTQAPPADAPSALPPNNGTAPAPSTLPPKNGTAPAPSASPSNRAPSAVSSAIPPANGAIAYKPLVPVANSAILVNSCDYHIYVSSVGASSCGPGTDCQLVAANTTYSEKIRSCDHSGISLKLSRTKDMATPMQFEYTVWEDKKTVSYDISYLDCMKNANGEQDLSACPGHDGGIQAAAGADCPSYQCEANVWCPQEAYVVAEFDYKPGAPVGACGVEKGVAFEICAANR
ncbi:hypothetical protein EJ02DRAFT_404565 [Clathrospora elynae]|uniref:Uncharacterized protein n=1 Tax=Clathrospora elynae TaxID=706981 RepID=A0A6A5SNX1_9PLEO|nr:hypothetical protein EJ02DRAFT_404565 [Clathrospora elynae]